MGEEGVILNIVLIIILSKPKIVSLLFIVFYIRNLYIV